MFLNLRLYVHPSFGSGAFASHFIDSAFLRFFYGEPDTGDFIGLLPFFLCSFL